MDVEQRARELLAAEYRKAGANPAACELMAGRASWPNQMALNAIVAALTQPEGHVVVTRNEAGQAVAVTRQDDEGRILSVIAELGSNAGWAAAADRELVAAELGVAKIDDSTDVAAAKLRELIDWHVSVAIDPAVNGGYVLVPVEPTEARIEAAAKALHAHGADSLCSDIPWDSLHQSEAEQFRGWAHAALLAARPEVKP